METKSNDASEEKNKKNSKVVCVNLPMIYVYFYLFNLVRTKLERGREKLYFSHYSIH